MDGIIINTVAKSVVIIILGALGVFILGFIVSLFFSFVKEFYEEIRKKIGIRQREKEFSLGIKEIDNILRSSRGEWLQLTSNVTPSVLKLRHELTKMRIELNANEGYYRVSTKDDFTVLYNKLNNKREFIEGCIFLFSNIGTTKPKYQTDNNLTALEIFKKERLSILTSDEYLDNLSEEQLQYTVDSLSTRLTEGKT
jgi:hypothetical protein